MTFHLKDMVGALVEDDGKEAKHADTHVQPAAPAPQPISAPIVPDAAVSVIGDADGHDEVYQKLAAKTDFNASKVFQTINSYLTPLSSMALDDKTKFKVALQQAQAKEGITSDAVLAAFDDAKATLQRASDEFAQNLTRATADQVDARKNKAEAISNQAKDLQAQATQLTEDAFSAQQKLQQAQHKFETASKTRSDEIDQEKSKYASLLA